MSREVCEHFVPVNLPCAKCEQTPALRTAAQQALAAMENIDKEFRRYGRQHWPEAVKARAAITALSAALAEPVQEPSDPSKVICPACCHQFRAIPEDLQAQLAEPVAWMVYTLDGKSVCVTDNPADFTEQHKALPLYTAPPQRKPLTEEERNFCPRCGKRSWPDTIHTCTPPQIGEQQ